LTVWPLNREPIDCPEKRQLSTNQCSITSQKSEDVIDSCWNSICVCGRFTRTHTYALLIRSSLPDLSWLDSGTHVVYDMSYKLVVRSVASLEILSGRIGVWVLAPRKNIVWGTSCGKSFAICGSRW
jgi:hypothetical protein